jgi:adenosylcobyric acid synthase
VRDGVVSGDGRIWGCYLHGLFANQALRHAWLASLGWRPAVPPGGTAASPGQAAGHQAGFERLADAVETAMDMELLQTIIASGLD